MDASSLLLLPVALGLLGFLEPCSIGASLLFLKSVEGNPPAVKAAQAAVFTLTRAGLIGFLGALAALIGTAFIAFQRFGYVLLGALYVAVGVLYLSGRAGALRRGLGPSLARLSTVRGAAALAALFGLNVPACATPLLAALLGAAALAGPAQLGEGFFKLALFGLALSAPLLVVLMFARGQAAIEWLGRHAARVPAVIGLLFLALGGWSIWAGTIANWAPESS